MDSSRYEQIGNYRFCLLRRSDPNQKPRFGWVFPVVLVCSIVAFLGASKWAVLEIERGNPTPSRVVTVGLAVMFVLGYVLALCIAIRSKKRRPSQEPRVDGSADGLWCEVRLLKNNNYFARSEGMLSSQGDLLTFKGGEFDFSLRVRDFHKSLKFESMLKGRSVRLLSLKGHGTMGLRITPVFPSKEEGTSALKELLDRWRRAPITSDPSLFPPFRRPASRNDLAARRLVLGCLVATIPFALLGLLIHRLFRDYLAQSDPTMLALALGLLPLTLILTVWAGRGESLAVEKSIRRIRESGKAEMV